MSFPRRSSAPRPSPVQPSRWPCDRVERRRDSDLADCQAVLAEVHLAERYPIHWPSEVAEWLRPPGMIAAWVARADAAVVGHLALVRAGGTGWLERLYIKPGFTGRGLGRALIQTAVQAAQHNKLTVQLSVADNCQTAIGLYRSLGWQEIGRRQIEWGPPEAEELITFRAPPAAERTRTLWPPII